MKINPCILVVSKIIKVDHLAQLFPMFKSCFCSLWSVVVCSFPQTGCVPQDTFCQHSGMAWISLLSVFVIWIFQLYLGSLLTSEILASLMQSSGTLHFGLSANLLMLGAQLQWFPQLDSLLQPLCFFPLLPYFCLVGFFVIYFYWKEECCNFKSSQTLFGFRTPMH